MSRNVLLETYKHYQVAILEDAPNHNRYLVNDPYSDKTLLNVTGFLTSGAAQTAAHLAIDAFAPNVAKATIATTLGGNNSLADSVITDLLAAGFTIVLNI